MSFPRRVAIVCLVGFAACAAWLWTASAQQTAGESKGKGAGRLEFEVVESFDARYLGDTVGHRGRVGIGESRPNVALGDPVYSGETKVGKVSSVLWERAKSSLDIEFDPEPFTRVYVGQKVSIGQER